MNAEKLEQPLGHHFSRPELLLQALTHRSFGSPHNERLEFLGDSILNCTVADLIFHKFPQLREGELSRIRAGLVKQETLAHIAQGLQPGDALRLGEDQLKRGGLRRPSLLAGALFTVMPASTGAMPPPNNSPPAITPPQAVAINPRGTASAHSGPTVRVISARLTNITKNRKRNRRGTSGPLSDRPVSETPTIPDPASMIAL